MRITLRTSTLSLLALVTTVGLERSASAQAPVTHVTPESIKIYNFATVNDDYYRGGQPLGEDYAHLAAIGVKTVVDLTNEADGRDDEEKMVEQYGMKYVHIPMKTRKTPTEAEIAAFISAVDEDGDVYVHCVGGRHRTGVMTAIYRMTKDGLNGEQAFMEMKQYKYGPDFLHPEFKKFVYAYKPKTTAVVATSGSTQQ